MSEEWADNARMIVDSLGGIVPEDNNVFDVRAARFEKPGWRSDVMETLSEMGLLHLIIPEDQGGSGLGMREYCAMVKRLGEGIVPEPVISSMLALRLAKGDERASGCVCAWQPQSNNLELSIGVESTKAGLCGTKCNVDGGLGATGFVVTLKDKVAIVKADQPGVDVVPVALQDGSFVASLVLDQAEADFIDCPADDMELALGEATLAHSAYLLGGSERAFEITLEYLRVREQFGKKIGSFQALQHRATQIKVQLQLAEASLFACAAKFDTSQTRGMELWKNVSRVKTRCSTLAMHVAREGIQMHGAIGYADESDIGLYARKAMSCCNSYGSASLHRRLYALYAAHLETLSLTEDAA